MKCCEKEVKTPFCPMCGKSTERKPLLTLLCLWHIQHCVERNQRALLKPEQYKGHHKSCEKVLCKWSEWAAELSKAADIIEGMEAKDGKV